MAQIAMQPSEARTLLDYQDALSRKWWLWAERRSVTHLLFMYTMTMRDFALNPTEWNYQQALYQENVWFAVLAP